MDDSGNDAWYPLLLAYTTLLAASVFGARPLVSYLALSVGADAGDLGLLAASYAVLAVVVAIPLSRFTARHGGRGTLVVAAAVSFGVCLALPSLTSLPQFIVATAVLGLGQVMAVVGADTIMAGRGPARKRSSRIGVYTSAASLGRAIGPGLIAVIGGDQATGSSIDHALLALACIAVAAALVAGLMESGSSSTQRGPNAIARSPSVLEAMKQPGMPPVMLAGVAALVVSDLLITYLPLYGEERGIGPQSIAAALAFFAFAQMGSRLVLGLLLDVLGYVRLLVGTLMLAAAVMPMLVLPDGHHLLWPIAAICGVGIGSAQPLTFAWIATAVPRQWRGVAIGVRMSGNRLGQLLTPAAIGATAGQVGTGAVFITLAVMLGLAASWVTRERSVLSRGMHRQ